MVCKDKRSVGGALQCLDRRVDKHTAGLLWSYVSQCRRAIHPFPSKFDSEIRGRAGEFAEEHMFPLPLEVLSLETEVD